jgi:hypothetical protein
VSASACWRRRPPGARCAGARAPEPEASAHSADAALHAAVKACAATVIPSGRAPARALRRARSGGPSRGGARASDRGAVAARARARGLAQDPWPLPGGALRRGAARLAEPRGRERARGARAPAPPLGAVVATAIVAGCIRTWSSVEAVTAAAVAAESRCPGAPTTRRATCRSGRPTASAALRHRGGVARHRCRPRARAACPGRDGDPVRALEQRWWGGGCASRGLLQGVVPPPARARDGEGAPQGSPGASPTRTFSTSSPPADAELAIRLYDHRAGGFVTSSTGRPRSPPPRWFELGPLRAQRARTGAWWCGRTEPDLDTGRARRPDDQGHVHRRQRRPDRRRRRRDLRRTTRHPAGQYLRARDGADAEPGSVPSARCGNFCLMPARRATSMLCRRRPGRGRSPGRHPRVGDAPEES